MLPFYQEKGDMATAVILAHEFGHGAQARLGLTEQFLLTIESELQADCFAGAWAQWAENQGLLGKQAIKQAVDAVISVADPRRRPLERPRCPRHGRGTTHRLCRWCRLRRDRLCRGLLPGFERGLTGDRSGARRVGLGFGQLPQPFRRQTTGHQQRQRGHPRRRQQTGLQCLQLSGLVRGDQLVGDRTGEAFCRRHRLRLGGWDEICRSTGRPRPR